MKRSLARYCADLVKPFSEEEPAEHRRVRPKREELRRIAVFAAAPLGLYAALVVVSLLGGPRIGAPLIPLPGADKPGPVSPVAGLPLTEQAMEVFPPIPRHAPTPLPSSQTPVPITNLTPGTPGPNQPLEPTAATSLPPTTAPTTVAPTQIIEPDDGRQSTRPTPRPADDPSTPPVTSPTPPPTAHPTPTSRPSTPTEPPDTPDEPDQPTLTDTLRSLLGALGL